MPNEKAKAAINAENLPFSVAFISKNGIPINPKMSPNPCDAALASSSLEVCARFDIILTVIMEINYQVCFSKLSSTFFKISFAFLCEMMIPSILKEAIVDCKMSFLKAFRDF